MPYAAHVGKFLLLMRRYWFYEKNNFPDFHQISRFHDPMNKKKTIVTPVSVYLSVVCHLSSVNIITFKKIITFVCALAHFFTA